MLYDDRDAEVLRLIDLHRGFKTKFAPEIAEVIATRPAIAAEYYAAFAGASTVDGPGVGPVSVADDSAAGGEQHVLVEATGDHDTDDESESSGSSQWD